MEVVIEAVEALVEESAVELQPGGEVAKRCRFESAATPLGIAILRDEAGGLEDLEVLRYARQAHRERGGKLGHGGLARCQAGEDRSTGRVGESGEGGAERVRLHLLFVHSVN